MRDFTTDFDHLDPAFVTDPYSVCADLRERCPVAHSDLYGGFSALSRYEDVREVLADPETFCSGEGVGIPVTQKSLRLVPIEVDPPEHRIWRSILNPLFSPTVVAAYEPMIREIVVSLIAPMVENGGGDGVEDLALQLPPVVLAKILGLPDWETFRDLSDDILSGPAKAEGSDLGATAMAKLAGHLAQAINERVGSPTDDVLTAIIELEFEGRRLTIEEALGVLIVLTIAGHETTTAALSHALLYLATHPEDRDRLVDDRQLLGSAVEEFLRFEAPVVALARTLRKPAAIAGRSFEPGERVLLLFGSANRDDAEFPEADRFILDRKPNRHLAFGAGIHRCIGSHLARLEMLVTLDEVLERAPGLVIDHEFTVEYYGGLNRGVRSLPLRFS